MASRNHTYYVPMYVMYVYGRWYGAGVTMYGEFMMRVRRWHTHFYMHIKILITFGNSCVNNRREKFM